MNDIRAPRHLESRADRSEALSRQIQAIRAEIEQGYGRPRMSKSPVACGFQIGKVKALDH
ncbi:hypothetical protein [Acidovorax sp.]|uniref:hypothetical protein n=1 Tax=Acidovorax sp. TaxID=1872122 RepID=UPI00391F64EA